MLVLGRDSRALCHVALPTCSAIVRSKVEAFSTKAVSVRATAVDQSRERDTRQYYFQSYVASLFAQVVPIHALEGRCRRCKGKAITDARQSWVNHVAQRRHG